MFVYLGSSSQLRLSGSLTRSQEAVVHFQMVKLQLAFYQALEQAKMRIADRDYLA